ncbi:MAG: FtsX-like permease family protein [Candidatus Hodarchaeales archaeon]
MVARLSSVLAFLHINLLHWTASRRRIILSLIFTGIIVGLAFSIFAVRQSNLDDLLVYYEKKNPLEKNGSPTVRFSTEVNYNGFPANYTNTISQYVQGFWESANLESIVSSTLLVFSIQVDMFIPVYNRSTSATIGGVPEEIFRRLDLGLTKGELPANSSEVIELGLYDRLKLDIDPITDNTSFSTFSLLESQQLSVSGQSEAEIFTASLEALFSPDLLEQSENWDFATSSEYLIEWANRFSNFHSLVYGYIEVDWNVEKIAGNLEKWKSRAKEFENHLEGVKAFLGTEMRFTTNDELSQLLTSFEEEKQHFDLTYLLLALPLFLLMLLVLLEINRLGNESQTREIELLYLNGVSLRETTAVLLIERLLVALCSLILGLTISPFFILAAQTLFVFNSLDNLGNVLSDALSIDIFAVLAALVFLTSIPSVINTIRRAERTEGALREIEGIWHRSFMVLATIIGLAGGLIIFSVLVLDLPGAESADSSDLVFAGEHLRFAASSMILMATPPLIIRLFNAIYGRIGFRIWKSHAKKATMAFQLFREEAQFLGRPALIIFLTLMLLVPSLIVTPSIDAHLEEESRLVLGSTLVIENWAETIPTMEVHDISPAIAATSLVYHVTLIARFPPLHNDLSILVIDPLSFIEIASLELPSTGSLISLESVKQLSSNNTMLIDSGRVADLEKGDWASFKAWETLEESNATRYVPHELAFQVVDEFDLFPLLSVITRFVASTENIDYFDELIMSHESWNSLSNAASFDPSISISEIETGLMVGLNDASKQEQIARKLQESFGRPVRSLNGVKESFESPFHQSYIIIGTTTLIVAIIAAITIGVTSANALLNRRRDGYEVLVRRGMSRYRITLLAAQEFGMATIAPILLGLFFGLLYLSSMEGILTIYEGQLSFQWLLNPMELIISVLALILAIGLAWIGSFYVGISRRHFATGE